MGVSLSDFPDWVNQYAARVATFLASVTGLWAIWRALRLRVAKGAYAAIAAGSLSQHFGPRAGEKLRVFLQDLDRRVTLSEALARAKEQYLDLAMYVCAADGSCTACNATLCKLFDLSEAEMLGSGWMARIAPDERFRVHENWHGSITRGIPYSDTYHLLLKNGARKKISTEASEIRKGETVLCYIGFCREVTDEPQSKGYRPCPANT